jgi:hypothetical protein
MSSFGFRFYFNRRRQWCDVSIHDVSVDTFVRHNGTRWGYYQAESDRQNRRGKFGEIHIVLGRVTVDLVAHEIDHMRWDWIFSNGITPSPRNEERLVTLLDEMTRNFWREYGKVTE